MRTHKFLLALTIMAVTSMSALANDYADGFVAAEQYDYDTAIQKWGPLADNGDASAQFNIALMYHSGAGVAANESEAVKWYKKAASNGHYQAQEFLAAAYAEGWFGLKKDSKQASYWETQLDQ